MKKIFYNTLNFLSDSNGGSKSLFNKIGKLKEIGQKGQDKAEKLFLIENIIEKYEHIINNAVQ